MASQCCVRSCREGMETMLLQSLQTGVFTPTSGPSPRAIPMQAQSQVLPLHTFLEAYLDSPPLQTKSLPKVSIFFDFSPKCIRSSCSDKFLLVILVGTALAQVCFLGALRLTGAMGGRSFTRCWRTWKRRCCGICIRARSRSPTFSGRLQCVRRPKVTPCSWSPHPTDLTIC